MKKPIFYQKKIKVFIEKFRENATLIFLIMSIILMFLGTIFGRQLRNNLYYNVILCSSLATVMILIFRERREMGEKYALISLLVIFAIILLRINDFINFF